MPALVAEWECQIAAPTGCESPIKADLCARHLQTTDGFPAVSGSGHVTGLIRSVSMADSVSH